MMKKCLTAVLAMMLICLLAVGSAGAAEFFYVSEDGDDGNTGLVGAPFKTIQYAVDTVPDESIIRIASGEYNVTGTAHNLKISKPVTLMADNPDDKPFLYADLSTAGKRQQTVYIESSDVTLDGLNITDRIDDGYKNKVVEIQSNGILIDNIRIVNCTITATDPGAGSVYIYGPDVGITFVENNTLNGIVVVANAAGENSPLDNPISITGNTITGPLYTTGTRANGWDLQNLRKLPIFTGNTLLSGDTTVEIDDVTYTVVVRSAHVNGGEVLNASQINGLLSGNTYTFKTRIVENTIETVTYRYAVVDDRIPTNISNITGFPENNRINITYIPVTTGNLSVNITDQKGNIMTDAVINWVSSNESILTIDNGTYTAISIGTVNVTASFEDLSTSVSVTVFDPDVRQIPATITNITGFPESHQINLSSVTNGSLSAEVLDEDGYLIPDAVINWTSSNESVLAIDSVNATYKVLDVGTTLITIACENITEYVNISVYKPFVPVVPIEEPVTDPVTNKTTITPNAGTSIVLSNDNRTATINTGDMIIEIFFADEATLDPVTGVLKGIVSGALSPYPEIDLLPSSDGPPKATLRMNITFNSVLTNQPPVSPVINETSKQLIENFFGPSNVIVGAMAQVDSGANNNITEILLIFTVNKTWVEQYGGIAKLKFAHVSDSAQDMIIDYTWEDLGDVYEITLIGKSFSDYSLVMDLTAVTPAPINSGTDDGAELLAAAKGTSATPAPATAVPTVEPTVVRTETVSTPAVTETPSGTQPTAGQTSAIPPTPTDAPVPLAGLLAGVLAAAAISRRK